MTTPASQELFALSRRVAAPYTDLPAARAAMVTGSVAKGISDYFSDVDMSIFYEDWLPDEETLTAIRSELGGSERKWMSGSREEGGFAEAFDLDGVEVQVIHTTLATWEATMAELQVNLKVDTPLAKALEGILICRPLYGDEIIERWRAQAADFPDALAEAMVKHYMKFFPAWGLAGYLDGRDATVWSYQILVEAAQNLVGIVSALNRVYFTPFQFKRMDRFTQQFAIAPVDFGQRVESLFRSPPEDAFLALEKLVDETLTLVEAHLPQIDTALGRRRIGWRQQPWKQTEEIGRLGD
ncbi:MAG: hypothetical protein R2873_32785 [Caldilineaceae bacterium]